MKLMNLKDDMISNSSKESSSVAGIGSKKVRNNPKSSKKTGTVSSSIAKLTKVSFKDQSLSFDILFCAVMQDENICLKFLRLVTGLDIVRIIVDKEQYRAFLNGDFRSVTFDIIAIDSNEVHYNIEMQASNKGPIPERCRFHQSVLDGETLKKSEPFKDIRNSYVIFVCDYDPFGYGCPRYDKKSFLYYGNEELEEWNDKSHVIVLNARYRRKNYPKLDQSMVDFLNLVKGSATEYSDLYTEFGQEVLAKMNDIKEDIKFKEAAIMYLSAMDEARVESAADATFRQKASDVKAAYSFFASKSLSHDAIISNIATMFNYTESEIVEFLAYNADK